MKAKFKLTSETKTWFGITMFRIEAHDKRVREAETRACAEVADDMDCWESTMAVSRAILARLDQPAGEA